MVDICVLANGIINGGDWWWKEVREYGVGGGGGGGGGGGVGEDKREILRKWGCIPLGSRNQIS